MNDISDAALPWVVGVGSLSAYVIAATTLFIVIKIKRRRRRK